jgi:hypothetical protein
MKTKATWQLVSNRNSTVSISDSRTLRQINKRKQTPWPIFREGAIMTDRQPLVGEVSANVCEYRGQDGILHSHCRENLKSDIALIGWAL